MKLGHSTIVCKAAELVVLLNILAFTTQVTGIASGSRLITSSENNHDSSTRVKRQSSNSNRGIFSLFSEYVTETRNDTVRAYKEIVDLVTKQIVPMPQGIQFNNTDPATNKEIPDDRPTTEATYLLTQEEFYKILRRNLRGLARLFNQESRKALEASNQNVRVLRKQLTDVVRPYVETNSTT